jgi:hypothetical protein
MIRKTAPLSFTLCRWENPETRCEHPFLGVAEDKSATLELGDYNLSIEAGVPDKHAQWLAQDFAPTDTLLTLDLGAMRRQINAVFACDSDFISVSFDAALQPTERDLSIPGYDTQTEGPEYMFEGPGRYRRLYREPWHIVPVTVAEREMLDVFFSELTALASRNSQMLIAPLPPRFR